MSDAPARVMWEAVPMATAPAVHRRNPSTLHATCPKCLATSGHSLDLMHATRVQVTCACGHVIASTDDDVVWTFSATEATIMEDV